jgi:flagellar capping protein FliD
MTIDDVNAYLIDSYGISLNIDNEGLISIDGYDETKPLNAYVKLKAGGTTKFLGITFETTTVTVGTTATSTTAIQYTKTSTVTSTTTLGSIYSKTIDGTITSSGVTGSVIAISTVTDLKNLSKLVSAGNTMEGKTFVLTNDIDFNNATFNQIGGNSSGTNIYFSGTFDGQGYTIKNIKYADCGNHSMSLFYGLDNAEVKNLNLDNVQGYINSNGCINGLAEKINSSTVSNVNFTNINFTIAANSTSTTTVRSATLSQTVNNSTIYGVSASGTIVDESSDGVGKWGGSFIHSAYGNVTIEACSTDVDFYEKSGAIGSFSFLRNVQSTAENVTISNCRIGGNANAFVHFLEDGYAGTLTITNTYGLADVEGRISSKIGVLEFNESEGKPSGAKYVNNNSFWLVNEDTEVPDPEELYYVNANEEFCVYQIGYDVENIAELFSSYSSSLWTATKQKSPTEYTLPTLCPDSDYSMKVYNSKHEIISYVTTNASTTLADIQSSLSSAGLSSSLINGIFSIGNSSTYKYVSGKLATNLGIGLSSVVHAQNVTSTAVVIDTSTQEAITEDTSLGDLELYDSQLIPITNNTLGATTTFASSTTSTTFKLPSIKKIHYECNIYTEDYGYTTVSLLSTSTIGDMIDCLAEYGINSYVNNGRLTICNSDSAYVSGIGQVTTTGATSYYIYAPVDFCIDENLGVNTYGVNTTSDTPLNIETIETLDSVSKGSVKLSDIGTFTSSNQYITINQNGTNYTLTITTDSTVDDVLRRISAYGIDTSLNSSGKVVLKGNDNSYIVGMSDNLSSALKLSTYGLNTTKITGTYSTDGTQYKTANSNTPIAMDTNLTDLGLSGVYNIAVKNGESTYNIRINLDNNSSNSIKTIEDLADSLAVYGVNMSLNNGVVTIQGNENSYILECDSALSSALKLGGNFYKVNYNTIMGNTTSSTLLTNSITPSLSRATLLSDLGVSEGVFKVVKDGVAYKSSIYEGETVGDLINNLASFGVITNIVDDENGTYLQLDTTGNLSIQGLETLFSDNTEHTYNYAGSVIQTTTNTDVQTATLATLLSDYDEGLLKAAGSLCIVQGDNISKIQISDDETFASFMDKLKEVGIESCLTDGKLDLYSNSEFKLQGITSNVCATLGLLKNTSINGYSMSADAVMETTSSVQELNNSVSAFANYNTKLSDLGISDGTLSIYNDGKKSIVQIDSSQTFADLRSKIATLSPDTDLSFDDGHLTFTSKSGATINIGTGNDTSNFAAVVGISGESGSVVKSSRELYKVNTSSLLTESGLFKAGDVTTGTFTIGNAEFTIDNKTTLGDLISQINSKEDAQTSAYWDSINGKLVLKSNTTGGAYINIEAGTSNFTDIMGYTYQENSVNHLNTSTQNLGSNAKFTINDTKYSSTSNTVTSDITRIKGLTLNLKGISDSGETATITVEKDKNSVADALSDIVDSYNELIDKIDTEVATGANLSDQSTLRLIRNQIRSIMTSSVSYNSVFKNLDSIGISLVSASNGNIDTSNVNTLVFDKDKFIDAYSLDSSSLKSLLVGDGTSKGILTQVEDIVESALQSVTGYFALAEKSYTTKISSLDSKITKAQQSVSTYQSRLEAKFSTMDMLIANMQNQYSSFLTS